MGYTLCGQETTDQRCVMSSRTPKYLVWVDSRAVQDYGGGGSAVCRTRCLCGELQLQQSYIAKFSSLLNQQFLAFFRMATKFLAVACLIVLVIMTPVSYHYKTDLPNSPGNETTEDVIGLFPLGEQLLFQQSQVDALMDQETGGKYPPGYFWMHAVFVYVFTALALFLLDRETEKIIRVRQDYLGSQSTITDRTIRLSGIPRRLQSEDALKDFIEKLEIGKVENVTLCRNWSELDHLMEKRVNVLRKLEEAWAVHLGRRRVERSLESLPIVQPVPPNPPADQEADDEGEPLLGDENGGPNHVTPYIRQRPTTRIRFGFLHLQSRTVDAIDYYEEHLHRLDERIRAVRQKSFEPTPLAFITLDSIATAVSFLPWTVWAL